MLTYISNSFKDINKKPRLLEIKQAKKKNCTTPYFFLVVLC